jgi:hypothetical protein
VTARRRWLSHEIEGEIDRVMWMLRPSKAAEATVGPVVVATGRTAHWVSGQLVVADRDDLELFGAARRSHRDDVVDLCLQERRRDRRDPRDAAAGGIELVDADDAHGSFGAGFVRHRGIGATPTPRRCS